jgi:hypothetical protein
VTEQSGRTRVFSVDLFVCLLLGHRTKELRAPFPVDNLVEQPLSCIHLGIMRRGMFPAIDDLDQGAKLIYALKQIGRRVGWINR